MSILIGELEFDGPFFNMDDLSDEPGIFAILIKGADDFELLEMDDAEQIRESLFAHPDRESWSELTSEVAVAVHYTSDITSEERREIKEALEVEFDLDLLSA